jgi:SDR family mycofactocin-dependent oxidoreductase
LSGYFKASTIQSAEKNVNNRRKAGESRLKSNFPTNQEPTKTEQDASALPDNAASTRRSLLRGASLLGGFAAFSSLNNAFAQGSDAPPPDPAQNTFNTNFLTGKVALVTGAARGIGRAIAVSLAQAGADIVAIDIAAQLQILQYPLATQSDLNQTGQLVQQAGRRFLGIVADVRNATQMYNAVQQATTLFGHIDIAVANAGVQIYDVNLADMNEEQWRTIIDTNLTGTAATMRMVLPQMIQRQGGSIIAIASVEGKMGDAGSSSYSASKWGIIGLVKSVALEVGKYDIRVNAICPGTVYSNLTINQASFQSVSPENPTLEGYRQANLMRNALPFPWLDPTDIGDAALYLSSPASRYITGATVDVALGRNAMYTA